MSKLGPSFPIAHHHRLDLTWDFVMTKAEALHLFYKHPSHPVVLAQPLVPGREWDSLPPRAPETSLSSR